MNAARSCPLADHRPLAELHSALLELAKAESDHSQTGKEDGEADEDTDNWSDERILVIEVLIEEILQRFQQIDGNRLGSTN